MIRKFCLGEGGFGAISAKRNVVLQISQGQDPVTHLFGSNVPTAVMWIVPSGPLNPLKPYHSAILYTSIF